MVETGAGIGTDFKDEDYAGASIMSDAAGDLNGSTQHMH
jgi:alanine dehydrogenase